MAEKSNGTIFLCSHCGERFKSNIGYFCSKCKTPEKRAKMDQENLEIWSESGKKYRCLFCENEKRIMEERV
jgi:DNA-directed RNA polymerase subunit RPC12/RpoP